MDIFASSTLAPFLDGAALAIVGGGTLAGAVLRTPFADLKRGIAALTVLPRRAFDVDPLLTQIAALTRIARRHGLIALDRSVIADADVKAAVAAAVDGAGPEEVTRLLEQRRCARFDRHRGAWELWQGAAELAPAMGMVGTLIGLVQMFASMRDPKAIGGAMAVALLATLYGALLASLVALPIASRLKRRGRQEAQDRLRIQAPLALLASIEPPAPGVLREVAA
jgi:chemotaxis protein MotA